MLAVLQYNFPVFSSVLLLIAGILIGYALWIPFRGDTAGIARQLGQLREQNVDLEKTLQQQRDAYVRLERRHAEQQDEWTYLRTWHQRVEKALEEQGHAAGSMEQGLAALGDLKEHALRELEIERRRRTELEESLRQSQFVSEQLQANTTQHEQWTAQTQQLTAQLAELQATNMQLTAENRQLATAGEETSMLQAARDEQRRRAEQLAFERDDAVSQLQIEREGRAELETLLGTKEAQLTERIEGSQQEATERLDQLQQSLVQVTDQCEALTKERDLAMLRLDKAHQRIETLETDLASHRRAFDTVERHRAELHTAARRDTDALKAVEQETQQLQQELEKTRADAALANTIQRQNESLQRQYKTLQEAIEEDQRAIQVLKADRDQAAQLLADEKTQREAGQQRIADYQQELDSLREQREEVLASLRQEQAAHRDTATALEQQTRRLTQISRDMQTIDELHEEVTILRARLAAKPTSAAVAAANDESVQHAIESARATIHSLQTQLVTNQTNIRTLKKNSLGLQERYDERIEQLTMERNTARKTVEMAEEKMAELQRQMDQLRNTVAELRREREDVLTRLRRQTVMLESQLAKDSESPQQTSMENLDDKVA